MHDGMSVCMEKETETTARKQAYETKVFDLLEKGTRLIRGLFGLCHLILVPFLKFSVDAHGGSFMLRFMNQVHIGTKGRGRCCLQDVGRKKTVA